jgi:hypothetical protein
MSGGNLKAGLISGLTGGFGFGLGKGLGYALNEKAAALIGSAIAGGAASAAQGGKFGRGVLGSLIGAVQNAIISPIVHGVADAIKEASAARTDQPPSGVQDSAGQTQANAAATDSHEASVQEKAGPISKRIGNVQVNYDAEASAMAKVELDPRILRKIELYDKQGLLKHSVRVMVDKTLAGSVRGGTGGYNPNTGDFEITLRPDVVLYATDEARAGLAGAVLSHEWTHLLQDAWRMHLPQIVYRDRYDLYAAQAADEIEAYQHELNESYFYGLSASRYQEIVSLQAMYKSNFAACMAGSDECTNINGR